jgi:hypothetical protein
MPTEAETVNDNAPINAAAPKFVKLMSISLGWNMAEGYGFHVLFHRIDVLFYARKVK